VVSRREKVVRRYYRRDLPADGAECRFKGATSHIVMNIDSTTKPWVHLSSFALRATITLAQIMLPLATAAKYSAVCTS
jgi:hypothetical protein